MDSFGGYASAQLPFRFNGGNSGPVINNGTGRHGNNSLRVFDHGNANLILKVPTNDLIVGFGMRTNIPPVQAMGFSINNYIFEAYSGDGLSFGGNVGRLTFSDSGSIGLGGFDIAAGGGNFPTSHQQTPNGIWVSNAYFHLQFRVKTVYSGGALTTTCDLKFNNTLVATVVGTPVTTANNKIIGINFSWNLGGWTVDWSDFYIIDMDDGIAPTNFISPTGDLDVSPLFPDANGITNSWAPLSAPNFSQVNEHPPDGDTSYVSSPTPGAIDLYHFPADTSIIPAGSVIYGVQENIFAKKDDPAGSRNITTIIHIASSGLNYTGIGAIALGNDYQYYYECLSKNYATGNPFQLGEVGGLGSQFGEQVLS